VAQTDAIISDVAKLNETVTNCLDFVRPLHLNLSPARLEPILEEAIAVAEVPWRERGIRIARQYDGDLPEVMIDSQKIRQVLINLLVNAAEAIEEARGEGEGGEIVVRSRVVAVDPDARTLQLTEGRVRLEDLPREGDWCLRIEIADNGCGMDAAHPFFTTKESGSGIGLAVAQKIVDEHRGFLDVESQPGAGSTFIVKFPLGGGRPAGGGGHGFRFDPEGTGNGGEGPWRRSWLWKTTIPSGAGWRRPSVIPGTRWRR
jgi:two-component system sensor histidine kinase AtoS